MSETFEQVRAAVLMPWCPGCGVTEGLATLDFPGHYLCLCGMHEVRPPLFLRWSGVPGLEWSPTSIDDDGCEYERLHGWQLRGSTILNEDAALLIIGHEARRLAEKNQWLGMEALRANDILLAAALASDTPVTDLAHLSHQLKDQQEQSDA